MGLNDEINTVNTDVLKGVGVPQTPQNQIAPDFNNWVPQDLSPAQKLLYQQQQAAKNNPTTGALGVHDYYPDINHQIGVGTFAGGSEVPGGTLFAPGGGLVPLGMMDARDAAVNHAALLKAKELQDFHNKYAQPPSSKLVNINPKLHENYMTFEKNVWGNAMKKAGNDPHMAMQYIENDPQIRGKRQAFYDQVKFGDDIVNKMAHDEVAIKEGKFYPDDEYFALKHQLQTVQDANHPDFQKMGDIYRQWDLHRNISQTAEEVMDKAVKEQTEKAFASTDATGGIRTGSSTNLMYSPETLADAADQVYKMVPGSDLKKIQDHINKKYGAIVHNATAGLTQPNDKEGAGEIEFYKNGARMEGGGANVGHAENIPENTLYKNMQFKAIYPASNYGTKQVLSAVNSPNQIDLKTGKKNEEVGNFNFNLQGVSVYPYNKKTNKVFSKEEIDKGALKDNPDVEYKVGAIANTVPKKDSDGNEVGGSSQTLILPPEEVSGRVDKHGDKGFDLQIKRAKEEARQLNLKHAEASVTPKEGEERAVQGGTAVFKNGKWQMK